MQKLKNGLLLLLSLLILIVVLRVFFTHSTSQPGHHELFRVGSDEDVSRVRLQDQQGNMALIEKSNERSWILNGEYPANMPAVRDLLFTLHRMDVRRPVSFEKSALVNHYLDSAGIRVEVYAIRHRIRLPGNVGWLPRDRRIRDFLVGADLDAGEGTFMRGMGDRTAFEVYLPGVRGGIREAFIPEDHIWKKPQALSLAPGQIKSIAIRYRNWPDESFRLKVDPEEGARLYDRHGLLPDEMAISNERIEQYLNSFRRLHYERLYPSSRNEPPSDLFSDAAFMDMEIQDADEKAILLTFYKRVPPEDGSLVSDKRSFDPNRFYLRINEGDYALALYYVFHPVMRPLSWFAE